MFFLILLWLCIGAIVGLVAHAAQLRPASWQPFGWLYMARMAALGALIAFCGGWLGIFLLGRSFATVMALWIAVVGVVTVAQLLSLTYLKKQAKVVSQSKT